MFKLWFEVVAAAADAVVANAADAAVQDGTTTDLTFLVEDAGWWTRKLGARLASNENQTPAPEAKGALKSHNDKATTQGTAVQPLQR